MARTLSACGCAVDCRSSRDITGHHENSRAFLEELRGTGASYTPDDRHGPSFIARVMQDYDQQYTTDLGVPATYEVLEFSATARRGLRRSLTAR